jgi:hypothetical protein
VVTAAVTAPGTINLMAVGTGMATVTLSVDDGQNPAVSVPFTVTVMAANSNPTIQAVPPQSVDQAASISVAIVAADPDGDPVMLMAVSNNPTVASAVANGPTEVIVNGMTPGSANITVDASDGVGGTASTSFTVTVTGVNNAPVIDPIVDQAVNVGEDVTIPVVVTDMDGDPIVLTAISQNGGVVSAAAFNNNSVILQGVAAGVTQVQVTADDAKGGVANVSFSVTVSSLPPAFNLMDYPVIPSIPPNMASSLSQLYQSGVTNFGNQAGAFSKVGDDPMANPNFMAPFATDPLNLGSHTELQATIDFFRTASVRPAIDPAINSFGADSIAAGAGYGIDTLAAPPPAGTVCPTAGSSSLGCEFQTTHPSIALISFSAPNVTYMTPEVFRGELQVLVSDSLSLYGVIPVLATIPAQPGYTTEQLSPYNQAIIEVATQSGVAGVPLWNLWRAMQDRGIADPNLVAPGGAGDLSEPALSFGVNVRNLTALQMLEAVRQAAGIS